MKNGSQTGPFTEKQIQGMLSTKMISRDDLIWMEGLSNWKPLNAVFNMPNSPPPSTNSYDTPIHVGGWLLFFCICLTIIGPFLFLIYTAYGWDKAEPLFTILPTFKSILI